MITGAGRGIGEAIAAAFSKEGASLALVARTKAQLDEVRSCCIESAMPLKMKDPRKLRGTICQCAAKQGALMLHAVKDGQTMAAPATSLVSRWRRSPRRAAPTAPLTLRSIRLIWQTEKLSTSSLNSCWKRTRCGAADLSCRHVLARALQTLEMACAVGKSSRELEGMCAACR